MEMTMCLHAIDTLTRLWEVSNDEDKQGLARHLFEYITFDLDKQEIVDFRLKAWADQFLVLRTALYAEERKDDHQVDDRPVALTGFEPTSVYSLLKAISRLIDCLYEEIPISSIPISFTRIIKADRNRAILQQYDEGYTLEEIAAEYSISLQRVHEIIKRWGP